MPPLQTPITAVMRRCQARLVSRFQAGFLYSVSSFLQRLNDVHPSETIVTGYE